MLIGILTVSDRCSQGLSTDTAGPAVARLVKENWPEGQIEHALKPDVGELICDCLKGWISRRAGLILTVGGTGLGPRDRTPEATHSVIEREVPGIAEAMRAKGAAQNPMAWLSRGIAGLAGDTLIVNLPGSLRGAEESLVAILPLVRHGMETIAGTETHS
jgi:molybdenum cofactor synthesis domain-containing protein